MNDQPAPTPEEGGGDRLAAPEGAATLDAYQARYMEGAGGALYHDKITAPAAYHLLFLLPLLIVIGSALVTGAPLLVPLLSSVPLILIWLLFSTLRISVDRRQVHVQYGLFGPKIPIEAIRKCEAVNYDWKEFGGWGIRIGKDGAVAYNMLADQGRAVRLAWTQGAKDKTVILSSRDPERLAAAVHHARASALPRIEAASEAAGAWIGPAELQHRAPSEEADAPPGVEAPPLSEKRRL
jgi:hypothetical protein